MTIQELIKSLPSSHTIKTEHWIDQIEYPPTWCLNVYIDNVRIFEIREKIQYDTNPKTIEAKVCKHIVEEIISAGLQSLLNEQ